jgi:hypothetical protein
VLVLVLVLVLELELDWCYTLGASHRSSAGALHQQARKPTQCALHLAVPDECA